MKKVRVDLIVMAHIDLEPKLNNRSILMMLSPLPKQRQKPRFRKEDEEVDWEAHEKAEKAEDAAHAAEVPDDHHDDEDHHAHDGEEE